MTIRLMLACMLLAGLPLGPLTHAWLTPLAAQDAGGDDDDDNDGDDDGGDDVGDPDDTDPGGADDGVADDGGADDGGVDDGGDDVGGDDAGGDDTGGDDDGGDDDGGNSGTGGDDDGGAAGGDDDGGNSGAGFDDDGGTGGNDDDRDDDGGAAGGDDDGGGSSGSGGGDDDDGKDDITDDRGDIDDADEAVGGGPLQWEVIAGESDAERAELDMRDNIDTDMDGFRYRRGEFIALDLSDDKLAELKAAGFKVIARETLDAVSGTLLLLRGPAQTTDQASLDTLEALADPDSVGYNHLFDSSSVQTRRRSGASVPERVACGCQIGLIDTGVAAGLAYFKHVTLVQRPFNGKAIEPRLHGTAVAHLVAGTRRNAAGPTKIVVADIFGGPRETAGSSFALVKALDWLAAQGVPVINISLSGPRNPAVATAIARITRKGHTIVAAAGNDGPAAPPVFPGAYDGVIAVTAVDQANRVYRYANRGKHVDFSARGVAVPAIDASGEVRDATGTSFAAPVIAVRLAAALRTPDAAAAQRVIRALEAEARDLGPPGRDPIYGAGLIDRSQ